jgi:alanine dehydrogenase
MLTMSAAETVGVLSIEQAADVIEATYRHLGTGDVAVSTPSAMRISGPPHRIQVKGAVLKHRGIAGARLSSLGHPRLILWDLATGEPVFFVDESWLYAFRTGISGAVVARWLMPRPRPHITLIGAGKIAAHMAAGFVALCNPASLRIAARNPESVERLIAGLTPGDTQIQACANIEAAVENADVVATITTASSPIVNPSWIKRGATVLSMGGVQEFEFETWNTAAHRFVDDLDYALYQGDLAAWVGSGAITSDEVREGIVSVSEVANSRWPGRRDLNESVYAVIQGLTALDISLAHELYRRANLL